MNFRWSARTPVALCLDLNLNLDLNLDLDHDLNLSPHTNVKRFVTELGHETSNSENLKKSKIKIKIKIEIKSCYGCLTECHCTDTDLLNQKK